MIAISGTWHPAAARRVSPVIGYHVKCGRLLKVPNPEAAGSLLVHDVSAARSACASAISGNCGLGEKPLSADASTAGASAGWSVGDELRQRERRAQLKTARLLLLRDGDCSDQRVLGRRRIRQIALEQNLAAERPASRGAT